MASNKTVRHDGTAYSDFVRRWFNKIDAGIEKRLVQEDRWLPNESFEDMKQWRSEDGILHEGEYDQPTINKVGSWLRTYRAALAPGNPRVKFTPKNAAAQEMISLPVMGSDGVPKQDPETGEVEVMQLTRAQARETLINDIISTPQFGLRDTISRVVKSGGLGYGVVMTGYSPTFETPLKKDTDDDIPVLKDGTLDFSAYEMDPLTGEPVEDEKGKIIKKNRIPVWEEWFCDWVHYRHMIIDPTGGNDFMKHRWVAMEQVRTLEEVKADPLFKNTKDLQGSDGLKEHRKGEGHNRWRNESIPEEENDYAPVRLFWIYDFVKDRRICLADGHGEVLLDQKMPLGITHDPFAFFRPNERITMDEEFYPRPLITDIVPLVAENNEARRHLNISRKRGIRKMLVEKGAIDPINYDKLTNDEDMEMVEVDKLSQYGLDKTIHMITPPPIGGDLYNNLNIISADIDEVGGMGSASRGKSTGDTATETNKLSQYEGTRYDFDRLQLRDMMLKMFSDLDDSIDANMTKPRAIQISGTAGQLHQVLLDRDMIAGDFDIDIDMTDMMPQDDAAVAARSIQFATMIGQNPWMALNEQVVRTLADKVGIDDEEFIKGIVEAAQAAQQQEMMMQQMMMDARMQQAQMKETGKGQQGKSPESSPPENSGQEAMQTAAGGQVPRQQGAS